MSNEPPHKLIARPQSPRWKDWDYSQPGAYSLTLCTKDRACLFGRIHEGEMVLNEIGEIVRAEWLRSAEIRKEILLDQFVVMPNHLHGIVAIIEPDEGLYSGKITESHGRARLPKRSRIGSFIAGFKAYTTKRINERWRQTGRTVWQPSFHDHVIRDERQLHGIRAYIATNPQRWDSDKHNPDRIGSNDTHGYE